MRAARAVLIGLGTVGLVVGAWLLVTTDRPAGLVNAAVWLVAAVVLHDAVLSPLVFAVSWVLRRAGRRLPVAVVAVVQVAAALGGIGSLLLLPAARAKQVAQRNPTVLPLDYAANLAGMWIALAVLTALAIALVLVVQRRRGAVTG